MPNEFYEAVFLVRLGTSWERAHSQLGQSSQYTSIYPYTFFPAGNELILKLTKNTALVLFNYTSKPTYQSYKLGLHNIILTWSLNVSIYVLIMFQNPLLRQNKTFIQK
jgi:hypothetical protein